MGDASLVRHVYPSPASYSSTIGRVGTTAICYWRGSSGGFAQVQLLAGGSWVLDSITPKPIGDSYVRGPYAKTSIAGTSAALIACEGDQCEAYVAVGTTAAVIDTSVGLAKSKTQMAALAKLIEG